jgi:hypothetical protein
VQHHFEEPAKMDLPQVWITKGLNDEMGADIRIGKVFMHNPTAVR